MNKAAIILLLTDKYNSFINTINGLTEAEYQFSDQDKWTAGQQLQHESNIALPTYFWLCQLVLGRKIYFNTDYHNNWKPEVAGMFLYRVICPDGGTVEGKVVAVR